MAQVVLVLQLLPSFVLMLESQSKKVKIVSDYLTKLTFGTGSIGTTATAVSRTHARKPVKEGKNSQ